MILGDIAHRARSFFNKIPYAAGYALRSTREIVHDMTSLSNKDFLVYAKYWLLIWACIAKLVVKRGPGFVRELARYPWMLHLLRVTRLMRRLCRGRKGLYLESICMTIYTVSTTLAENLEDLFYHQDRLIISEEMVPPDIARAMGLKVWILESMALLLPFLSGESDLKYIDEAENAGVNPDSCSLPKATMGMVLKGHMPKGLAMLSSNMPCDAGMASYSLMEKVYGIPVYRIDAPYNFYNERAEKLIAEDLLDMIAFLEKHTPGRMDWKRLKDICEGRNRMLELELELWDMIRIRPAPLAAEAVFLSHMWHVNLFPGHPTSIKLFERLVEMARRNQEAGVPATENERFRAVLWNPPFPHFIDIFNYTERTYGVTVINDSMTFHRHEPVDTSSPDTIVHGLGRTIMQGPMVRHTRGPAENYLDDIFRTVKQFDLDMVWVANHVGCKSAEALNGMLREMCRERKIPVLILDYDLLDPRIVSSDNMINQVEFFMENVMRAGRLNQQDRPA
ncbi:MAG TPA: 2-hydroxyacyl-CoA dehydratase [Deltaproteobacteria bacterium]|nr:2-hydroxyacyl-CoA dehydratase [Deltaproteobacteria bacterium]